LDATSYAEGFDAETQFIPCAICGTEGSVKETRSIFEDTIEAKLKACDIKGEYERILNQYKEGPSADHYSRKYVCAMEKELQDGLFKDATIVCNKCFKELPKRGRTKETKHLYSEAQLPKFSAIKGLFPGAVPPELQDLSTVEKSMIALYSPVTTLSLNSGKFDHTEPKTFTLVNDMADIVKQLPNMQALNSYAILRHSSARQMTDFEYRPNIVKAALYWLKDNNHLYRDIPIVLPTDWHNGNHLPRSAPFIDVTAEDLGVKETEQESGLPRSETPEELHQNDEENIVTIQDDTVPTNTGTDGSDQHILLQSSSSVTTMLDNLKSSLQLHPQATPVFHRRTEEFQFAHPYTHRLFFWEKCFPTLWPYAYGGPSDPSLHHSVKDNVLFQQLLQRGAGEDARRFQ
jgi:hypothetical protein